MKKLPRFNKLKTCYLILITLLLIVFYFVDPVRAQEAVEIPGPDLEDASFIPVGDLKIGDWVFVKGDEGLVPEQITGLEYHQEEVEVYNLSVDGDETFFANDFAVHNKGTRPHKCEIYVTDLDDQALKENWTFGNTGSWGGNFKNLFRVTLGNCCHGQCLCLFGKDWGGCDNRKRPWYGKCVAGQQDIRIWTLAAGRENGCSGCWDTVQGDAPAGWLFKKVEFTFYLSTGWDPKARAWFEFRRKKYEVLADWKVCVRPKDCPLGVQGYQKHVNIPMNPATKSFTFNTRVAGKIAGGYNAIGRLHIYNLRLHMIKEGAVNNSNVDLIREVVRYGYACWPCRWNEVVPDGVNDNFCWWEDGFGPACNSPPQENANGTRRHLYPLTLRGGPGKNIIRAISDSADENDQGCSTSVSYTPPTGTIRGTVYDVTEAGTSCPFDISGGGVGGGEVKLVGATEQGPISISGDGTFSFPDIPPGQYTLLITDVPEGYVSPAFCDQDGVSGDATVVLVGNDEEVVNIGLTKIGDPWFQTTDGDVHAQTSITDPIPPGAIEGPYCSLLGDGGYPGVISHGTSADFGDDGSASEKGWLANSTANVTYSFDYFYQLLDSPAESWDGSVGNFPADPGTGETEIVYTAAVDANLPGFSNLSGRKIIVLASEDANINSDITITNGFLAVIASENINIDPSVAAVHGIYIADEAISTGASDTKLEAEGMFINGEDPGLDRDYGDVRNNTDPAMAFTFRPDLWLNSPTELWRSSYTWQELPP